MFAKEFIPILKEYETETPGSLRDLKKVNIFVGANNAGKSRFMRSMFTGTVDDYIFYESHNTQLREIFNELKSKFNELFTMADLKSLMSHVGGDYANRYNEFIQKLENDRTRSQGTGNVWNSDVAKGIRQKMKEYNLPESIEAKKINHKTVYVPILRGLRILSAESSDVYKDRTINDYSFELGNNKDIFTGQTVYEDVKRMLLGKKNDRKLIADFESFLSENFFANKSVTLVSDYKDSHLKIDIGNGEELRELCNVGDGIQSIILCCFPAFQFKDQDMMLFIEEPELMMHPSVQRVLVEVLVNAFPNLQVFLTTHSNHFLDLVYDYTDDVSVFSFQKEANSETFTIRNVTKNLTVSDLLGVRNSSVLLANSVIWTEGVTDRMLFRCLLSLDDNFKFIEDYHYTFAEYGGANIKNYNFSSVTEDGSAKQNVPSISKNNLVMMDNDLAENGSNKLLTRQQLKKVLGSNGLYDNYIEIENLIPFKVWYKLVEDITANAPKISYKLQDGYEKNESKFNGALPNQHIGEVIKKYLVEPKKKQTPQYYKKNSIECLGFSKKEIMERVTCIVNDQGITLEEMGDPAKRVVTQMKVFINRHNPKNL